MLLNLKFAEHENAVNYRNNMRGKLRLRKQTEYIMAEIIILTSGMIRQ